MKKIQSSPLVLAIVLWAWIPFCWQPLWGQAPGVGAKAGQNKKQQPGLATGQHKDEQRGTNESPLVVDIRDRQKSFDETAKDKAENDWKHHVDTWTVNLALAIAILTGLLVLIGGFGVRAANRTLKAIERQANLMAGRVHVDSVRAVNLEIGKVPVIFVKIRNSGMVAAEVFVSARAEHPGGAVELKKDQRIVIPANDWRESFLPTSIILTEDLLNKLNGGEGVLRVSGNVKWNQETMQYCYKYFAWTYGDRPDGVPSFVPCDFEPGLAIEASGKSAGLSTFSATLRTVKNPSPDPPKESSQPN